MAVGGGGGERRATHTVEEQSLPTIVCAAAVSPVLQSASTLYVSSPLTVFHRYISTHDVLFLFTFDDDSITDADADIN